MWLPFRTLSLDEVMGIRMAMVTIPGDKVIGRDSTETTEVRREARSGQRGSQIKQMFKQD